MRQTTLKTIGNCTKSFSHVVDKDFFGIAHVTSKDIAGSFKNDMKLAHEQLIDKYQPLIQPREQLENKEHEVDVTFGSLRVDGDNVVRRHGQFEPKNERKLYDTTDIKQRYVPIDVNPTSYNINEDNKFDESVLIKTIPNYNQAYKISEVEPIIDLDEILRLFKSPDTAENLVKYSNKPPLNFVFTNTLDVDTTSSVTTGETKSENLENLKINLAGGRLDDAELESCIMESRFEDDTKPVLEYDPKEDKIPLSELDSSSEEYHERNAKSLEFDKSLDARFDIDSHRQNQNQKPPSKKALEYLKDIRAQRVEPTAKGLKHRLQNQNPYNLKPSIKLDSQGFRNYSNQVPDWRSCRHIDILNHLQESVIYNNYDILAINKPYGIPSHIDSHSKVNMNDLIQEIAKKMRIEKVYLAHRLDLQTTGVLLFATSQKRADLLNKLFKSDQIKKTYWAITCGVPKLAHAIIDIPIGQYTVAGKVRRCLVPEKLSDEKQFDKKFSEARRAVTEYRVIKSHRQAALIEVKPRSGIQHQIRCHLGFGLNTPILGDHKYSHFAKVAPQKLPSPLLGALNVRQAKARTLPMHLHAKSIVIPGAKANGETLFIDAPLPPHFIENMKSLKLNPQVD